MKIVKLFSDGSSLGNPGFGGWAYILQYNGREKTQSGAELNATNNQMELKAVIMGLEAIKEPCEIEIYTDSTYVANGINSWLEGWIKKDFKKIMNVDLWKKYLQASKIHKIKAFWIKGHNKHPQNEKCDQMAKKAAVNLKKREIR